MLLVTATSTSLSLNNISALIDPSSVGFDNLFSIVEEHVQEISNLEKPDLEMRLRVHNAEVFNYQKAVDDYPKNVCCSCQQLHQKKKYYGGQV